MSDRDVPRHLTRSPALRRLTNDVYVPVASAGDFVTRCSGLALVLPPGGALSHTTAARLWGAPLPCPVADRLHVSLPAGYEEPQRKGINGHKSDLAAELLDAGSASRPESLIRVWLGQAGLPRPEANGWIVNPSGVPTYRGDLVFRSRRVIVEHEGAHHRGRAPFAADLRRRNDLVAWGWREA